MTPRSVRKKGDNGKQSSPREKASESAKEIAKSAEAPGPANDSAVADGPSKLFAGTAAESHKTTPVKSAESYGVPVRRKAQEGKAKGIDYSWDKSDRQTTERVGRVVPNGRKQVTFNQPDHRASNSVLGAREGAGESETSADECSPVLPIQRTAESVARIVHQHLAYRDDEFLDMYVEARRFFAPMRGMPHENYFAVIVAHLRRLAGRPVHVVIEGPVGSGRFSLAKALRDLEPDRAASSISLSAAGIDADHLRQSLTAGCVLVLRDIDSSSLEFQRALLGVLHESSGLTPFRVICTSTRPLSALTSSGSFDPVLERRLAVGSRVIVPSLNHHRWDIPPIVLSALDRLDPDHRIRSISYAALDLLVHFDWRGEVAELLRVFTGAVQQALAEGADRIQLAMIGDQFKGSTPLILPEPDPDPFGIEKRYDEMRQSFLHQLGSVEMATFYTEQFRDDIYSWPLTDRERVDNGWADFRPELWSGCYAVTGNAPAADELYDHCKRTGVESQAVAEPSELFPDDAEEGNLASRILRQEWSGLEKLKARVRPLRLDASYGTNMFPTKSEVREFGLLTRLNFSIDLAPMTGSPVWLSDGNWMFRDSWNVPLKDADERILFLVDRMREDLDNYVQLPTAVSQTATHMPPDFAVDDSDRLIDDAADNPEFKFGGVAWDVSFQGFRAQVRHKTGMDYIATLLAVPYQVFKALDMYSRFGTERDVRSVQDSGEFDPPVDAQDVPEQVGERSCDDQLMEGPDTTEAVGYDQTVFDPAVSAHIWKPDLDLVASKEGLRVVEREIEKFTMQRDEARRAGDNHRADELEAQIAKGEEWRRRSTGYRGRPRRFTNPELNAAQAVSKAIRDARKLIREKHPVLAAHLKSSIKTGSEIQYAPDTPRTWFVTTRHQ